MIIRKKKLVSIIKSRKDVDKLIEMMPKEIYVKIYLYMMKWWLENFKIWNLDIKK